MTLTVKVFAASAPDGPALVTGDGTTIVAAAMEPGFTDPDNDHGGGDLRIQLDQFDAGLFAYRNIVRVYDDGVAVFSWIIKNRQRVEVPASKKKGAAGRLLSVSGPGALAVLQGGAVFPEQGFSSRNVTKRRFDFSSKDLDDTAWGAPVVLNPAPHPLPEGWNAYEAKWVHGTNDPAPVLVGTCYYRLSIAAAVPPGGAPTTGMLHALWASADDGMEVVVASETVFDVDSPYAWAQFQKRDIEVPYGPIWTYAVRHTNRGAGSTNVAGLLLALVDYKEGGSEFQTGPGGLGVDSVIYTGGPGWKCLPYPANPPGLPTGKILRLLVEENKAKGALPGLGLGFADLTDSAGQSWGTPVEQTFPVGMDLLEVLEQMHEDGIVNRFEVDPASWTLRVWANPGADLSATVRCTVATNLEELSYEGSAEDQANAFLVSFQGGGLDLWIDPQRAAGAELIIEHLSMGNASRNEVGLRVKSLFAERRNPIDQPTAVLASTPGARPYRDFTKGNTVGVSKGGAEVPQRVRSITGKAKARTGRTIYVPEFESIGLEPAIRLTRALRRMMPGSGGGTVARASPSAGGSGPGQKPGAGPLEVQRGEKYFMPWGQPGAMAVGQGPVHIARKASTSQTVVWTVVAAAVGDSTLRLRVNGVLVGATVTLLSGATSVTATVTADIPEGARWHPDVLTVGSGGKIAGIVVYY